MRTFVIGDIHGGLLALKQCIERANVSPGDTIIFLGDYVDGWSESAEVIEYVLELRIDHNCITILGNHDAWCKDWLDNPNVANSGWLRQGGLATVESYRRLQPQGHRKFFHDCKLYYIDDQNRLFIHGGFTHAGGVEYERDPAEFYWDRTLIEGSYLGHKHYVNTGELPEINENYKEIFVGHTSTTFYKTTQPMHVCNLWALDTGGGWEGYITIMDVETKEYWQSDKVSTLYPNEKGRG